MKRVTLLLTIIAVLIIGGTAYAETKEIALPEPEATELEVVMLATPSEATPSEAEKYGTITAVSGETIICSRYFWDAYGYKYKYAIYHEREEDLWYVIDTDTGRLYRECRRYLDEDNRVGLDWTKGGLVPTLIIKDVNAWVIRNWAVMVKSA